MKLAFATTPSKNKCDRKLLRAGFNQLDRVENDSSWGDGNTPCLGNGNALLLLQGFQEMYVTTLNKVSCRTSCVILGSILRISITIYNKLPTFHA